MSHKPFCSENLEIIIKILFFNDYPQDLIENHIKIRIEQVKSSQGNNVDMDIQSEGLDEHNTIILPYFGQIFKKIRFMFKKLEIDTSFRILFWVETLITLGKDILNRFHKIFVVYKLICKNCEVN